MKKATANWTAKLGSLFRPKSIAILGASREEGKAGNGIVRNLRQGCIYSCKYCKPFQGKLYPVNPNAGEVLGLRCYPSIRHIKDEVELAIVAVPAAACPQVVMECCEKGVKAIILISSGFAETGEAGKKLQEEIAATARNHGVPLLGPNCLGVIRPSSNLNASFAPAMPPQGGIALLTQSGALADSVIDWAIEARYGFSTVASYGNKAVLDSTDFLEWLAADVETKVIAIYMEGLNDGRRFAREAAEAARKKPIVALKAGKTKSGRKAASTHTGSLAGSYEVYRAVLERQGVHMAATIEELFDVSKALATLPPCRNSIAIVTNGGGCGTLLADYCDELGVKLCELKESLLKRLDQSEAMHHGYSRRNPLDIIGDALPERYEVAVNELLKEPYVAGMIVVQTLQSMTNAVEDAKILIEARKAHPEKPIISVFLGGKFSKEAVMLLEQHGIPDYNELWKAANAMKALIKRHEWLDKNKKRS